MTGSYDALRQNRQQVKEDNTSKLWDVVSKYRKKHPKRAWSYSEICLCVGLKSTVALKQIWNASIKEAIDTHNESVKNNIDILELSTSSKTKDQINKDLRSEVRCLIKQLDDLHAKQSVWEAEADLYKRMYEDEKIIVARKERRIQELTEQLNLVSEGNVYIMK